MKSYFDVAKGKGGFSTDNLKELRRLRGEEEKWYSNLKSPRYLIPALIGLTVTFYMLITEFSKLGV